MTRVAILLLALGLLSACASQTTEPHYYLLRSDEDASTREMQPSEHYALGRVMLAPYIDQQGLLLETSAGELRPARHHLWAEPLYEGVRIFLLTGVSQAAGYDILPSSIRATDIRVNVRIDQLHGTSDGSARLVAYWWLVHDGEIQGAYQFAEYQKLDKDGYAALANAEKALLSRLAKEIAATLVVPPKWAAE